MATIEFSDIGVGIPADFLSSDSCQQYACLTLHSSDCLRLIQFPVQIIDIVRQTIQTSWHRDLQNEKVDARSCEFKLKGNLSLGKGPESVQSGFLMMSILSALHHQGWYLLTSTNVSSVSGDKDILIFRLGILPSPTSFFAVSFNEGDKLRLISAPFEVIPVIRQILGLDKIQREEWIHSGKAYQFKLRGYPWFSGGHETVTIRIKLLALLDCFTRFGWELHGSIKMSEDPYVAGYESYIWFFRRHSD